MLRVHFYNVSPVDMPDGSDRVIDVWTTADGRFMLVREEDNKPLAGVALVSRDGTRIASQTLPVMDNDHLRSLHRLLSEGLDYPGYSVLPVLVAEIEAREIGYFEPRAEPEIRFTFEERQSAALRRVKGALRHADDAQRRAFLFELSALCAAQFPLQSVAATDVERDDQGAVIPEILKSTPAPSAFDFATHRLALLCGQCGKPSIIFRGASQLPRGARIRAEDCYFVEQGARLACLSCGRQLAAEDLNSQGIFPRTFTGELALRIFEADKQRADHLAAQPAKGEIWHAKVKSVDGSRVAYLIESVETDRPVVHLDRLRDSRKSTALLHDFVDGHERAYLIDCYPYARKADDETCAACVGYTTADPGNNEAIACACCGRRIVS